MLRPESPVAGISTFKLTLADRFWLWNHHYCTKHLVKKMVWRRGSVCILCKEDTSKTKEDRLQSILDKL